MSKSFPFIFIVLALIVIGLMSSVYIVPEYNKAVVLRFGEEIAQPEPGLHFKIPLADRVRQFDGRILTLDSPENSYYTRENKQLVVDSFAKWQITNVNKFYKSTGGDTFVANRLLLDRINDSLGNEIGVRTLHEVVSGQRDKLMEDLVKDVNISVANDLGVDVIDVRVKRIDLPDDVKKPVFDRMVSAREKVAKKYRSEGEQAKATIIADTDRQTIIIAADAYKQQQKIMGEGDAEAAGIYAEAFSSDPEFYAFVRSLKAYEESFNAGEQQSMLVLDPKSEFFQYLNNARQPGLAE